MRGVRTRTDNKWKRLLLFVIFFMIAVFLFNSLIKIYQKKRGAERALTKMQNEIETLVEREKFLSESLKRLQTEEGLKFEVRKKLNVAVAGEQVAIIVETESVEAPLNNQDSLWQKMKNFFTNLF